VQEAVFGRLRSKRAWGDSDQSLLEKTATCRGREVCRRIEREGMGTGKLCSVDRIGSKDALEERLK